MNIVLLMVGIFIVLYLWGKNLTKKEEEKKGQLVAMSALIITQFIAENGNNNIELENFKIHLANKFAKDFNININESEKIINDGHKLFLMRKQGLI